VTAIVTPATAALFAVAAWTGVLAAGWLCEGLRPCDDGPAPFALDRRYAIAAAACLGAIVAVRHPALPHLALSAIAVGALAGCAAADAACGFLPDVLTLGPLLVVAAWAIVSHDRLPILGAIFVLVPFAAAALLTRGRGMGWGDVKLATLGGALLGARDATLALILASLAAYVAARRAGAAGRPIAFGPYLAASIALTLALRGAG
jgi:prepilin signal peptidase PulO-like enzyme (type II secretory pathway)